MALGLGEWFIHYGACSAPQCQFSKTALPEQDWRKQILARRRTN